MIKEVWDKRVTCSKMYKVQQKLKLCKQTLITWRKREKQNAGVDIAIIQREMERMQVKGGTETGKGENNLKYI